MLPLADHYWKQLEALAGEVQAAENLEKYLEEEEEEYYLELKAEFEPKIAALHLEVATNDPLQLVSLEKGLLHEAFEGLFLPKILGYAVLRGEINDHYKYIRPQEHFQEVLLAICNSANFDILRKRIGQSIQVGFGLSSDIWVTNLVEEISNKRIRNFLNTQRLDRYRNLDERKQGYHRYLRQFQNDNYMSAEFPTDKTELQVFHPRLKHFLKYRIKEDLPNETIIEPTEKLISDEAFMGMQEHLEILSIFAHFFNLKKKDQKVVGKIINQLRKEDPEFSENWFQFVMEIHDGGLEINKEADMHIKALLDESIKDDLKTYYELMEVVHTNGYAHEKTQDAVKKFYLRHEGLSTVNECVRRTIYNYFARLLNNLEVTDYPELFELAKYYAIYIEIFSNQQFNQNLKDLSMKYIRRLLKHFTDKRGKDYQDIKKFVSTTFVDLGFLTEKETVELFKTRRKKRKAQA